MDEKPDQSDNLKVYIRALKEILENDKSVTLTEYKKLIDQYQLSEAELERLEELAISQLNEAEMHYESGNWDICLKTIEDAAIKSPFNSEILHLHIKTLNECIKFSEENSYYVKQRQLVLQRLKEIDRKSFRTESRKPVKIPHFLFVLIPLVIIGSALFLLLYEPSEESIEIPETYIPTRIEGVVVQHNYNITAFNPRVNIVENEVKKFSGTFQYNLKLLLSSESYNISNLEGVLKLYDRDNHLLVTTPFSSNRGHNYYKNEEIPIVITLNSLREGPDIRKAVLDYTVIEKSKSQERENLKPLITVNNPNSRLVIKEYNNNIIQGINTSYMEWELVIENNSTLPIEQLKGEIEWFDSNKIVISSSSITLLDNSSINLHNGSKRFIYRLIELPETITDNYRLRIRP